MISLVAVRPVRMSAALRCRARRRSQLRGGQDRVVAEIEVCGRSDHLVEGEETVAIAVQAVECLSGDPRYTRLNVSCKEFQVPELLR